MNETLAISGVLTSTGNIQIDGEGTSTTVGGNVFLPSANQLSNGTISIGTVATTSSAINQAGTLIINPDTGVGTGVATGSDNIIVNEQSQLLINSGATAGGTVYFGSANTTITLDGSGNGTNSGACETITSPPTTITSFSARSSSVPRCPPTATPATDRRK